MNKQHMQEYLDSNMFTDAQKKDAMNKYGYHIDKNGVLRKKRKTTTEVVEETLESVDSDNTPFLIVKEDELEVLGDANLTQEKRGTYNLDFEVYDYMIEAFPKEFEGIEMKDEGSGLFSFSLTFENKGIIPRNRSLASLYAMKIMQIMAVNKESYEEIVNLSIKVKNLENPEELNIDDYFDTLERHTETMTQEVFYDLIVLITGIDDFYVDYLTLESLNYNAMKIISDHPDLFKEGN